MGVVGGGSLVVVVVVAVMWFGWSVYWSGWYLDFLFDLQDPGCFGILPVRDGSGAVGLYGGRAGGGGSSRSRPASHYVQLNSLLYRSEDLPDMSPSWLWSAHIQHRRQNHRGDYRLSISNYRVIVHDTALIKTLPIYSIIPIHHRYPVVRT